MKLNQQQIELIKKIVDARLTKDELKEVTSMAEEIINRRTVAKKE